MVEDAWYQSTISNQWDNDCVAPQTYWSLRYTKIHMLKPPFLQEHSSPTIALKFPSKASQFSISITEEKVKAQKPIILRDMCLKVWGTYIFESKVAINVYEFSIGRVQLMHVEYIRRLSQLAREGHV